MYNTTITPVELGMSCIVVIGYIWGKLWIHYKVHTHNKGNTKKPKGVIKRGREWD